MEAFLATATGQKLLATGLNQLISQTGQESAESLARDHIMEVLCADPASVHVEKADRSIRTTCYFCDMTQPCAYTIEFEDTGQWYSIGANCATVAKAILRFTETLRYPSPPAEEDDDDNLEDHMMNIEESLVDLCDAHNQKNTRKRGKTD